MGSKRVFVFIVLLSAVHVDTLHIIKCLNYKKEATRSTRVFHFIAVNHGRYPLRRLGKGLKPYRYDVTEGF